MKLGSGLFERSVDVVAERERNLRRAADDSGGAGHRRHCFEAGVQLANSTNYGLGAGVFTGNVANAVRFAREVDAGNVHINWTPLWRADLMPYGGLKGSGVGKEGPRAAVQEMTDVKTIVLHGNA